MIATICIIASMGLFGFVTYLASDISLRSLLEIPLSRRRFRRALQPMTSLVESDGLFHRYTMAADTIDSVDELARRHMLRLTEEALRKQRDADEAWQAALSAAEDEAWDENERRDKRAREEDLCWTWAESDPETRS